MKQHSEHVVAYYLDKHERAGGTFDVYVPGSGHHMRDVSIREAAAHKRKLHDSGVYCVYINHAGCWDGVAIW